jgi:hypothetical protein
LLDSSAIESIVGRVVDDICWSCGLAIWWARTFLED